MKGPSLTYVVESAEPMLYWLQGTRHLWDSPAQGEAAPADSGGKLAMHNLANLATVIRDLETEAEACASDR